MPASRNSGSSRNQWFLTTRWSVVLAAGGSESTRAGDALEALCRAYWYPLYAFVRRLGHSPHDAEDLVQAFFARCLEKNYLSAADRAKGRFRSFLLIALKRFLANEWDKARTRKRGGAVPPISLDALAAEQRYARHCTAHGSPTGKVEGNLLADSIACQRRQIWPVRSGRFAGFNRHGRTVPDA